MKPRALLSIAALTLMLLLEARYALLQLREAAGDEEIIGCFFLPVGTMVAFGGLQDLLERRLEHSWGAFLRLLGGVALALASYALVTRW